MKFFDIEGNIHRKDIRKYRRQPGWKTPSLESKRLVEKLERLFPGLAIYQEMPCFGSRLRIDFYIHELKLAFEYDGRQHEVYDPFFHGSKAGFMEAKNRDLEKKLWCEKNTIRLVRITEKDLDSLKELINES